MNSRISAWAGMMFGAMALLMWNKPVAADDAAIPSTAKIAVCDPLKVFRECMEGKDATAKWTQEEQNLQGQLAQKKDQLQAEGEGIKILKPTSDEFETKVEKFVEDQANAQAWSQAEQTNTARKERVEQKALIDKILGKIADIAKAQGVLVVVNSSHPDFPEIDKMDPSTFFQTIMMHTSLYADPSLDITPKVIIAMDQAYSTSH